MDLVVVGKKLAGSEPWKIIQTFSCVTQAVGYCEGVMSNTTRITTSIGTITVTPMFAPDSQGRRRESGVIVPVITMTDAEGRDVAGSYGPVRNHPVVKSHFGDYGFTQNIADQVEAACEAIRESDHNKSIRSGQRDAISYSINRDESDRINSSI